MESVGQIDWDGGGEQGASGRGGLLAVLERRLRALIARHRELLETITELRSRLADRDRQMEELQNQVATLAQVRDLARERVDRLIARVDELESRPVESRSSHG